MVANPFPHAVDLSVRLNCTSPNNNNNNPSDLLNCLKRLPFEQLLSVPPPPSPTGPGVSFQGPAAFGPTVDRRSVVMTDVRSSMADAASELASFANVSLMVGFASNDAAVAFNDSVAARGLPRDAMQAAVAGFVDGTFSHHRQTIYELLLHQYRDWNGVQDDAAAWNSLVDLLGDALYAVPAIELGLYHVAATAAARTAAKTFLYCFNFTVGGGAGGGRADAASTGGGGGGGSGRGGAGHGDDLAYIFAAPITDGVDPFPDAYTKYEKSFTENIVRYWIHFIKTG